MTKTLVVILLVVALIAGTLMSLRRSAKTGMPSEEVLKRTTQRARELEAQEKSQEDPHRD